MAKFITKIVKVKDLLLDANNPRFCHVSLSGRKLNTQEDLEKEILKDEGMSFLIKTIKKSGVIDPIWVKEKNNNGKYIVIEGNRRTTILRKLLKEGDPPPLGKSYDEVTAHVYDSSISKQDELLQKARLQTGKKVWGAFNEAAVTYILRKELHMEYEDISIDLQITVAKAKQRIEDYELFNEYSKVTGDQNTKKFAFFSEAPKSVREWFSESDKNKHTYFDMISPKEGIQKIRSVSTKGGVRDFAKIIESPAALDHLINEEESTVESAFELAKQNDISIDVPFITKLSTTAAKLMGLDVNQIKRINKETKYKNAIKSMKRACEFVIKEMTKL